MTHAGLAERDRSMFAWLEAGGAQTPARRYIARDFGKRNAIMNRDEYTDLEQLPNVGPATARDLRRLGISRPRSLVGKDPYALYERLCRKTGERHDPCVMDVFLSVVRFMEGAPAKPWWAYTAERKRAAVSVRPPTVRARPIRER